MEKAYADQFVCGSFNGMEIKKSDHIVVVRRRASMLDPSSDSNTENPHASSHVAPSTNDEQKK
jgi:hypothetical protein